MRKSLSFIIINDIGILINEGIKIKSIILKSDNVFHIHINERMFYNHKFVIVYLQNVDFSLLYIQQKYDKMRKKFLLYPKHQYIHFGHLLCIAYFVMIDKIFQTKIELTAECEFGITMIKHMDYFIGEITPLKQCKSLC